MNRLAYVELERFRSFKKKARIEFPEKGLVRIRGKNRDTGGESGAGKSTIALAINYALGKCAFPATHLQSWGASAAPAVDLGFRDGARIERGKKFDLTLAGRPQPVEGSARQKEEELSRLFGGYDMDMVMALTYRGQKKPGLFLSKTDSERKEFLTRLLGLDKFEQAMETTGAHVKTLRVLADKAQATCDAVDRTIRDLGPASDATALVNEEAGLKSEMAAHEVKIVELRKRADAVKEQAKRYLQEVSEAHAPKVAEHAEKIRRLQQAPVATGGDTTQVDKWKVIVAECQKRLDRLNSEDLQLATAMRRERDALASQVRDLNKVVGASAGLSREKARLSAALAAMTSDVCPTCERDWDRAQEKRQELSDELAQVEADLQECSLAAVNAADLQRQLASLPSFEPNPKIAKMQKVQADALASAAAAQQKLDGETALLDAGRREKLAAARAEAANAAAERDSELAEVRASEAAALQDLQRQVDDERAALGEAQMLLNGVSQRVWQARQQADHRLKLDTQLAEAQVDLTDQLTKLHAEEDFLALIGREGFLGSIFDEVLAEIGDETNQLLASVANTRHCTLRFDSETTTQKGTVRKEIKPIVTIHGYEAPLESGPSGGMISVIELAVDLALGAVISRRTGMCPGWLILDESFDGLGAVEKESAMEILQRYAADRLVLVVDHTSEFQGSFAQCITVEYAGGDSWVGSDA